MIPSCDFVIFSKFLDNVKFYKKKDAVIGNFNRMN